MRGPQAVQVFDQSGPPFFFELYRFASVTGPKQNADQRSAIAIEYRWSEGRTERYAEIAAEFVRLNVDVIVTVGSAVPTVRQATSTIPIVFAVGFDPVGTGLVASLAKPGGNVTGLSRPISPASEFPRGCSPAASIGDHP